MLGLVPVVVLGNVDRASPWYLGSFALGMTAARVVTAEAGPARALRERRRWRLAAGLFIAPVLVWVLARPYQAAPVAVLQDLFREPAAACLIVALARASVADARRPRLLRLLECRPALRLGACSFSLYLIHAPLLGALHAALHGASFGPAATVVVLLTLGSAVSLAAALAFAHVFEPGVRQRRPGRRRLRPALDAA